MARLATSALRSLWAPPCEGPWARVTLFGGAAVSVDPLIVEATLALNSALVVFNYPTRTDPYDTGAYNCRKITGGSGYSLHSYGIAIDIRWQENPYGPVLHTTMPLAMVIAIEAIRTKTGKQVWGWGGRYTGNKDAMHFEIVCSPADLATGLDGRTLVATIPGMGTDQGEDASMPLDDADLLVLAAAAQHGPRIASIEGTGVEWVTNGYDFARKVGPKYKAWLAKNFSVGATIMMPLADASILGNIIQTAYGTSLPKGFKAGDPKTWP